MDELYVTGGSSMGQKEAESLDISVKRWLAQQDHSFLHPVANRLLTKHGIEVAPDSEEYKTLSRELMVAFQSILQVRIKRSQGDYSVPDDELIPLLKQRAQGISESAEAKTEVIPAVKFSEVQESYQSEVEKAGNWTEKTKAENLSIFALFVRVMGDLAIDKIDRKLMAEYKTILMKLPPNLNKSPLYKDMSIEDIIAAKPPKTLTVNTLNKYIRRLSGLFNYAVRNGYMTTNPAEGTQIKSQKRVDQERNDYSKEDLEKLFGSKEYREGNHRQSYGFWTPLIALYTGCRLEEICQLHLEDIRQEDGVWVFDINDKNEKRLKNMSSERLVPIHPQLMDLGLIDYAKFLQGKGEARLFPELQQRRDGYGQTVSKWFGRYKERLGFGKGQTFHSFRHTFITHLKHKQVDPFMIHELDGHTVDSETMGRYGKKFTPEILLKEAIQKLDYGIDFSDLKWISG
ncbi:site-specific integrase [Desulfopila sp. IMCC35006]|uniref:site-specific integrase n=1 Tax=Desulfopila sp. IMCC35006 TaxID=2569542 RepID=UPI00142F1B65|nr:site-specific integrase [Desulfopila sp. IMCC35006]